MQGRKERTKKTEISNRKRAQRKEGTDREECGIGKGEGKASRGKEKRE